MRNFKYLLQASEGHQAMDWRQAVTSFREKCGITDPANRRHWTVNTIKLVTNWAPRQLARVPDPDKAVGTELQIRDVYTDLASEIQQKK